VTTKQLLLYLFVAGDAIGGTSLNCNVVRPFPSFTNFRCWSRAVYQEKIGIDKIRLDKESFRNCSLFPKKLFLCY
jgi:hypothetical protein